ncbi:MAG: chemotaxis protein CheA [Acidobacteriota bacterium]|nr:chemotaxis protein CheA [Acidobacteriota bacterium]
MTDDRFELDEEIVVEFIAESLEHLDGIDQKLMEYEKDPENSELLDGIFRAIHSIKGSSGFLDLSDINSLSHRLETLLDQLRKGERAVSTAIMDVLFQGCDILRQLVSDAKEGLANPGQSGSSTDDDQLSAIHEALSHLLGPDQAPSTEASSMSSSEASGETPENTNLPGGTEETRSVEAAQSAEDPGTEEAAQSAEDAGTEEAAQGEPGGYNITPEILQEFRIEAEEHLDSCEKGLVRLSEVPDDREAVNSLFRDMHSIKGTAAYLGLDTISHLAHASESLLEVLRRQESAMRIEEDELDLLFEALDLLRKMVADPAVPNEKAKDVAERISRRIATTKADAARQENGAPTSSQVPESGPMATFAKAVEQHRDNLKECLPRLTDEAKRKSTLEIMERAARSLKNSARYMDFQQLEGAAGNLEDQIAAIRSGKVPFDNTVSQQLADRVADLEKRLADILAGKPEEPSEEPSAVGSNHSGSNTGGAKEEAGKASAKQTKPSSPRVTESAPKTMRVNQELLDTFMNLVGELIVARNAFGHIERRLELGDGERGDALKDLRAASLAVARISEEMQRTVMEMRMVPIRTVFQKFPRMIRDLSKKSGKRAQIILQGEETEIDKGIAEELGDPLVHIIRNSIDHGMEPPEERLRAGKPEVGTVILRAAHEGNFIIIEIVDDGRGINTEAVLEKAIEKGLVSREQAQNLSHEDICGFIFKPGFSTAKNITDISGRGVGMDVVLTNLKKLKGNVHVSSEQGQGTIVRLEVPLTLALVDALLVEVDGQTFAMPLDAVAETVKVRVDAVKSLMKKKAITLREEVVSVADLAELLGIQRRHDLEQEELTLLILKLGGNRLGVIVDRIQRKEEIVVKPLADYLTAIPGLAGASILGDGRSILILEPGEMMTLARTSDDNGNGTGKDTPAKVPATEMREPAVSPEAAPAC